VTLEVPAKRDAVLGTAAAPVAAPLAADIRQTKEMDETSQIAYPALADDLINTGSPYLASVVHEDYTTFQACRIEALNDGDLGQNSAQPGIAFDFDGAWTTTFRLDTAKAPKGYEIREIRSLAGWLKHRANQKYELAIASVGKPDVFVSLGLVEYAPDSTCASRITLNKENGPLATGVAALRFRFMPQRAGVQSETAYREIDVLGAPLP
jgi:hypothetical protein